VTGQSYSKCTACSDQIVKAYSTQGFAFLLKAFNEPKFLEDVTGLTELHKETEAVTDAWEGEEDDF